MSGSGLLLFRRSPIFSLCFVTCMIESRIFVRFTGLVVTALFATSLKARVSLMSLGLGEGLECLAFIFTLAFGTTVTAGLLAVRA